MRKIFLYSLMIGLFSCESQKGEEVYQGNIDDLVVDSLIIFKDSTTARLDFQKVIDYKGERYFV